MKHKKETKKHKKGYRRREIVPSKLGGRAQRRGYGSKNKRTKQKTRVDG